MKLEPWLALCRRYAEYYYSYADMVDDFIDEFNIMHHNECTVEDAVRDIGADYDLDCAHSWSLPPCPLSKKELNATCLTEELV